MGAGAGVGGEGGDGDGDGGLGRVSEAAYGACTACAQRMQRMHDRRTGKREKQDTYPRKTPRYQMLAPVEACRRVARVL